MPVIRLGPTTAAVRETKAALEHLRLACGAEDYRANLWDAKQRLRSAIDQVEEALGYAGGRA